MGEFVRMGNYNNRPYYKQRDTEGTEDLYMYYTTTTISHWWLVSDTLGRLTAWLGNNQDTDLPPRANWLYSSGMASAWWWKEWWFNDDQTLKLDYTTLSHHKLVTVAESSCGLNNQSNRMGDYRFAITTTFR